MAKEYIRISWDKLDISVRAELLSEFNPIVCKALRETLPSRNIMSHAVVAGSQMYWPYRLVVKPEDCNTEDMSKQPEGRINLELDFQYLSMNYGPVTEAVPAIAVAQVVDEDLPKLPVIGQASWNNLLFEKDYIIVEITYLGGDC